ncbi:hypothetical protein VOLCADRAFT_107239 [Volvox carteri f. nagariensis]|uniref:Uncharacterized protein n=1 Tax=Volvox carteri f. nagariensis TaxID=3068 RepID=D8UCT4_VOLCA|nr:uncharacterized protein VOLCADRAFT_107239 [Volvox carteri f. nagariensis]EFJ42398.1 hypothetical protein VOLCADRAFT_107239 [Volvox carteri f. nagariensis]|eukprot:XP_002956461.1 hypothetical protein VOLCADRAFT_107239 [Volvox carteri f. nagariensis]
MKPPMHDMYRHLSGLVCPILPGADLLLLLASLYLPVSSELDSSPAPAARTSSSPASDPPSELPSSVRPLHPPLPAPPFPAPLAVPLLAPLPYGGSVKESQLYFLLSYEGKEQELRRRLPTLSADEVEKSMVVFNPFNGRWGLAGFRDVFIAPKPYERLYGCLFKGCDGGCPPPGRRSWPGRSPRDRGQCQMAEGNAGPCLGQCKEADPWKLTAYLVQMYACTIYSSAVALTNRC